MSLWTPYKDEPRVPCLVKPPLSPPSATPDLTFHQPPHPVVFNNTPKETQPSTSPSYQYIGYDPVPLFPQEEAGHTRTSWTPDSGCSSGSLSPQPRLKISRPFRQMTSTTGTTMTQIREYYAQTLQNPKSNPRMRRAVVGKMEEKETDIEYVERRKKNNAAAKRSREMRKLKEDQLAINLAFLEAENHKLNHELTVAKERLELYVLQSRTTYSEHH